MEETGSQNDVTPIQTWLKKYLLQYSFAVRHTFIKGIRDGTLDLLYFKRWLELDYIFVRAFVPFVASVFNRILNELESVLIKAAKESLDGNDLEVILSGMIALNDEITWFKKEASKWGISQDDVSPKRANLEYCSFLESLARPEVEYTVAVTAFWAIERVYRASFAHCLDEGSKTPKVLEGACKRWGNGNFKQYCVALQGITERQLDKASEDELIKAEIAFLEVLEHEEAFWNMSYEYT